MEIRNWPNRFKSKSIDAINMIQPLNDNALIYTPDNIADDMLDLLPNEIWSNPDARFLNIACKNGIFIDKIYWRLYEGLAKAIPYKWERSEHIFSQIYALCPTIQCAENSRCVLYGSRYANGINNFTRQFEDKAGNIKVSDSAIMKEFKDMTFDVVIGNPPYNKGMDLDFVKLGFDLCSKYCIMITPAKWQTAADDYSGCVSKTIDYKGFREKLVPHMSKVVFYPCCKDIFDIYQHDGISYYILDKNNIHIKCTVENKCNDIKSFNGIEIRSITHRESLLNIGNEIIQYLGSYKCFNIESLKSNNGAYRVYTGTQPSGYDWFATKSPRYVLGISRIVDKNDKVDMGTLPVACKCIFSSNDITDCKSFVSWLNTRFTRFFLVPNISKLTGILTNDCFRFVPAPPSGNFDHIYTDEELYKAFNLPQKYIDVIEAVIKERKIAN